MDSTSQLLKRRGVDLVQITIVMVVGLAVIVGVDALRDEPTQEELQDIGCTVKMPNGNVRDFTGDDCDNWPDPPDRFLPSPSGGTGA